MRLLIFVCALIAYTMAQDIQNRVEPVETVSNVANQFNFNLFKTLTKSITQNMIVSPLSAYLALSMTSYGARDETKKQMDAVLKIPADQNVANLGFQKLFDTLNNVKNVDIKIANKIFVSKNFKVKQEFQTLTKDIFRSEEQQLDFSKSVEAANTINKWCENKTNDKIKDLVTDAEVTASTSMVLVNAVYFNGRWPINNKFEVNNTKDRDFYVDENTVKKVPTMYQSLHTFYGKLPELKAEFVKLSYEGFNDDLIIVLPDKSSSLQELKSKLGDLNLETLVKQGGYRKVELYLPKFKTESSFELNGALTEMGMGNMFIPEANFKDISEEGLSLSKIKQKAFIEVNEEGTEAAAATEIGVGASLDLDPTPIFSVDRPFLYFITHTTTDTAYFSTILFSGQVSDPTSKN